MSGPVGAIRDAIQQNWRRAKFGKTGQKMKARKMLPKADTEECTKLENGGSSNPVGEQMEAPTYT
jgi:hypothetical protein